MWQITRTDPYGGKGFKTFDTREEAEEFLKSPKVAADEDDGFWFSKPEYIRD